MAIEERQLEASNQWEIKATGDDVRKLSGMLQKTGAEAYRESFHKNEANWERISDPNGNQTVVPKDQVEVYRARGYGQASSSIRMVMPEIPWKQKRTGPGKHKFRYNKLTKCMEEV